MYFDGGIPPSQCTAAFGVVLITGRAARKPRNMTLLIMLQMLVVWGVTNPHTVGRLRPGHHTSDPKVATGTIHASTALTNAFGAAP